MSASKKILSASVCAVVLFAMTVFLSAPARYAKSVLDGISLWALNVLPATFPFLFLTALLTGLHPYAIFSKKISPAAGKFFRISGVGGSAAILSALSGYPVGARIVADLYGKNTVARSETFRLACLCSTSGPVFLVGTVGCLMYGSAKAGWIALCSHLIAVWLVCFLLRFTAKPVQAALPSPFQKTDTLYENLYNAVVSILCVGGFITLFYCLGQMLSDLGFFKGITALLGGSVYAEGICRGLLEMTTGCNSLSAARTPVSLALSCFLVTFGGVCVLCQQASYLSRANVKIFSFLGVKLLQASVAFGLCLALSSLFGV